MNHIAHSSRQSIFSLIQTSIIRGTINKIFHEKFSCVDSCRKKNSILYFLINFFLFYGSAFYISFEFINIKLCYTFEQMTKLTFLLFISEKEASMRQMLNIFQVKPKMYFVIWDTGIMFS